MSFLCSYLIEVSKGFVILHHHLCKLQALLGVDAHDVTQEEDVVGCEVHLLRVQDDLLELTGLRKTLNHLEATNTMNQGTS